MEYTLKNRPQWFDSRDSIDKWFEGFEKRQRELLSQLVAIASNNADSIIALGNERFELSRAERYGIILHIRKEILG